MRNVNSFQNTNPARGRKRVPMTDKARQQPQHFRTRTPQGDGNDLLQLQNRNLLVLLISEHEPRKGTETYYLDCYWRNCYKFQNTNPARGRKLPYIGKSLMRLYFVFQNTNPARGRKPIGFKLLHIFSERFQNTNPARGRKPSLH